MRIYRVNIEHKKAGLNWSSVKVAANTCKEAIRKAEKDMLSNEVVESVELIAVADK